MFICNHFQIVFICDLPRCTPLNNRLFLSMISQSVLHECFMPFMPTYDFVKFSEKLHEIEKILGRGWGGGGRSGCAPLNPPLTTTTLNQKHFSKATTKYEGQIYLSPLAYRLHEHISPKKKSPKRPNVFCVDTPVKF